MSYPAVKESQGATLLCLTTSWTAEIVDINLPGQKYEKLDVTKLSSVAAKEYIQSSLYDSGEADIKYHYNPDSPYPLTCTGETFTILYPAIGTATANTARSQTAKLGFIIEANKQNIAIGKIMEGMMKICFTGVETHTNTQ